MKKGIPQLLEGFDDLLCGDYRTLFIGELVTKWYKQKRVPLGKTRHQIGGSTNLLWPLDSVWETLPIVHSENVQKRST